MSTEYPAAIPEGAANGSATAAIEAAISGRRSVRAFLPTPVPESLMRRILDVSARAPSGTNMQPWKVYALAGQEITRLSDALMKVNDEQPALGRVSEYEYYPAEFFDPYLSRRRKVGWDLYGMLGIAKGDKARMHAQHARNLLFFDAPVGLMFTVHRGLKIGSWLDYGMFLQNIMVAARAHGLETCPQAAFAPFHETIRQHLPIGADEIVVCGMAIGYEKTDAPENGLVTDRVPADEFTTFLGFSTTSRAGGGSDRRSGVG